MKKKHAQIKTQVQSLRNILKECINLLKSGKVKNHFLDLTFDYSTAYVSLKADIVVGEPPSDLEQQLEKYPFFLGNYENTIDGKGRVIIPSKFRNQLKEFYEPKKDFKIYLVLLYYTKEKEIIAVPEISYNSIQKEYTRFVTRPELYQEASMDKQGRVHLHKIFIDKHKLIGTNVNVVGEGYPYLIIKYSTKKS